MKEADITFGQQYLVDHDEGWVCATVIEKLPPGRGKARSRTYRVEIDGTKFLIDASKILSPWSEFEKTPTYATRSFDLVAKRLTKEVDAARHEWAQQVRTFVESTLRPYIPAGSHFYVGGLGRLDSSDTNEEVLDRMNVSLPMSALIGVAGVAVPPPSVPDAKVAQRREILADAARGAVGVVERALLNAFDHTLFRKYVEMVRAIDEPGPHGAMLEIVSSMNNYDREQWRSLPSDPLFSYLSFQLTPT